MEAHQSSGFGPPLLSSDPSPANAVDAAWVAANLAEAEVTPFSSEDLLELSRVLEARFLESGEVLFREGQKPSGVWILQAGAIELTCGTGPDRAVVRILYPGEAVGDIQILRNVISRFKARAAEPSACLFIPCEEFLSLVTNNPSVGRRWLAKLALQVTKNHSRILSLLTTALRDRVARFLLLESVDGAFRQSQATIAAMLGIHRSSVNQILGEFESAGLVRVTYRCIEIVDKKGLTRVADGMQLPSGEASWAKRSG
jgi:CRP/FNR family transcriptional regulator, cAMP and macrophage regulator